MCTHTYILTHAKAHTHRHLQTHRRIHTETQTQPMKPRECLVEYSPETTQVTLPLEQKHTCEIKHKGFSQLPHIMQVFTLHFCTAYASYILLPANISRCYEDTSQQPWKQTQQINQHTKPPDKAVSQNVYLILAKAIFAKWVRWLNNTQRC